MNKEKQILINCDDLGYHPCINNAICEILSRGIVCSASLMPTAPYFDHAVRELKLIGKKEIGVHLALHSEYRFLPLLPVLPAEKIDSILTRIGKFHSEISTSRDSFIAEEVRAELKAQIEVVLRAGFSITHLDGHMFFYEINEGGEFLYSIVRELASEYKVPFRSVSLPQPWGVSESYFIWDTHKTLAAREEYYLNLLQSDLSILGEVIIHPGNSLPEMAEFTRAGMRRFADYQFFKSKEFEDIAKNSVKVIGWQDVSYVA